MNIGVGGIVSLGGGSSNSGGGSSGIQSINSQTGPAIIIAGVNGIVVTAGGNTITIDAASLSGLINITQSGVVAGNGIDVQQSGGNFVISSSGVTKFATSFSSITSGIFTHNLGTLDVIVQINDDSVPRRVMLPDDIIIENANQVSVIFNRPQTGRIVIV